MQMPTGKLILVLRTATDALPINNGSVSVTDESGKSVFFESLTASDSGLSRTITLEAPPISISLDSENTSLRPYSLYTVSIRADGSYRMQIIGVQIFENSPSVLPIELIPLPEDIPNPEDADVIIIRIPAHLLTTGGASSGTPPTESAPTATTAPDAVPAVNIETGVYIPKTVTVHLGAPDEDAPNVTVAFSDYIKNVASSEIYPSWPEEALTANIIAQISLALNRVYTEWYRSRGYDFDITNSTAFDQAFVYGRNIFEPISTIVDEIFNRYLVRPNRIEPLFASYCNGTTSTCAGLSQWGTVALAESGQSSEDILGFYYGDVIITETDDIRTPEESYPGTPLSEGDEGESVRILQEQLNRIAINFPLIPLIEVNGIYGQSTVDSVSEFQRLFILPVTGITDRATWYRVSRIYSSVKRLAEITSEGQRAAYNQQLYPGEPIRLNSRGSEVQEIQFYLQRISRFNPEVESPDLDGIFGRDTERAVISFQNAYGVTPTGIIDESDWNLLVNVYNGTLDNVDEPQNTITPIPYPNEVIGYGSSGEYVRYIQQLINAVNDIFVTIPELAVDGIFGRNTEGAVNRFAELFGFAQNGRIDESLWNKLNSIYTSVSSGCIFSSSDGSNTRPYPNYILTLGSRGENVRYIQQSINRIHQAIPFVAELETDGIYGANTSRSVSDLQRIFGLTASGSVNESTHLLINFIQTATENGCLPTNQAASAVSVSDIVQDIPNLRVSELKEIMRRNGINTGNGFLFGIKSRRALAQWQSENGLEPTGLPDRETRTLLIKKADN